MDPQPAFQRRSDIGPAGNHLALQLFEIWPRFSYDGDVFHLALAPDRKRDGITWRNPQDGAADGAGIREQCPLNSAYYVARFERCLRCGTAGFNTGDDRTGNDISMEEHRQ